MTLEDLYRMCALKGISLMLSYNEKLDAIDFKATRRQFGAQYSAPVQDIKELSNVVPCMEVIRNLECLLCDQEAANEGRRGTHMQPVQNTQGTTNEEYVPRV